MEKTQPRSMRSDRLPVRSRLAGQKRALLHGCTVVMRRELAYAHVLAHSFEKHHPGCKFSILVLDGAQPQLGGTECLALSDLGLPDGEAERWPMIYDSAALAEIVKPFLLRYAASQGAESSIFFAPQIKVFAPLTDIAKRAANEGLLITQNPDLSPAFIASGPGDEQFLDEWIARITCRFDANNNGAPDDAWLGVTHLDDPACNVGYWNIAHRQIRRGAQGYEIEGKPLKFFYFRGYDPHKPHLLSRDQGDEPVVLLSERPDVAALCDEYRDELLEAGYVKPKIDESPLERLPSGLKIDLLMKRIYREALEKFRAGEDSEPVSPFGPRGEQGFLDWLNEPLNKSGAAVTRYMLAAYGERDDLHAAFPDPTGNDAAGFHDWFLGFGRTELNTPVQLLPPEVEGSPVVPALAVAPEAGGTTDSAVNVAGYFRAELGIGEAARSLAAAFEAAEIDYNSVSYHATANRQEHLFVEHRARVTASDLNIVCVNANQLPDFAEKMGPKFFNGRYTAGVWFWEVEDFPAEFHDAFRHVDEVWAASEFIRQTLAKVSPKPVFKFDLPILKPPVNLSLLRGDLRLPSQFVFLFSFDFLSVLERKNPLGLIEAFRRAFKAGEGPVLVIKTINGDQRIAELEKLKYAAAKQRDVIIADGYLSSVEKNTMVARCDCYVSLHRSEGFGLTMAEAMALGKPVIATGYSGNMEFMTAQNSYLCGYTRCEVGPERAPYPATSHWAEPDLDEAAAFMRQVYENPDEARERGLRAAAEIAQSHSPALAGAKLRRRIETIRRRRARVAGAPSLSMLEDRLDAIAAATQQKG